MRGGRIRTWGPHKHDNSERLTTVTKATTIKTSAYIERNDPKPTSSQVRNPSVNASAVQSFRRRGRTRSRYGRIMQAATSARYQASGVQHRVSLT